MGHSHQSLHASVVSASEARYNLLHCCDSIYCDLYKKYFHHQLSYCSEKYKTSIHFRNVITTTFCSWLLHYVVFIGFISNVAKRKIQPARGLLNVWNMHSSQDVCKLNSVGGFFFLGVLYSFAFFSDASLVLHSKSSYGQKR